MNQVIDHNDLCVKIHSLWSKGWFVLAAGSFAEKKYNCMTVSWGSMGTMWEKPFVQVVVRPSRYTYGFMESSPDFTLCAFPKTYRKALNILGTRSGRDEDKIAASGLTACKSSKVSAPSFIEANLVLECRKIYTDVINPLGFIDHALDENYPIGDYHKIYYGEVLSIRGDKSVYAG